MVLCFPYVFHAHFIMGYMFSCAIHWSFFSRLFHWHACSRACQYCLQIFFRLSRGRANAYFLALSNRFMLSRAFSTIASFRPCRLMQWWLVFCVMTVYHVIGWLSVMSQLSIWYAKSITTRIEFWLAFIVFASSPCLLTDLRNIRHSNRGPIWTEHN